MIRIWWLCLVVLMVSCGNGEQKVNTTNTENAANQTAEKADTLAIVQEETTIAEITRDSVEGDYNGDGKTEVMWLESPILAENGMDCEGPCDCIIKFSDATIPDIPFEGNCIGGFLQNEGDIDSDGADDISIVPDWFTSRWRAAHAYYLKDNQWELIRTMSIFLGNEGIIDFIKKDENNPKTAIIQSYNFDEDQADMVIETITIKFK